jgi:hypothetical protein
MDRKKPGYGVFPTLPSIPLLTLKVFITLQEAPQEQPCRAGLCFVYWTHIDCSLWCDVVCAVRVWHARHLEQMDGIYRVQNGKNQVSARHVYALTLVSFPRNFDSLRLGARCAHAVIDWNGCRGYLKGMPLCTQVGFFKFIVLPLLSAWVKVFPECQSLLNQVLNALSCCTSPIRLLRFLQSCHYNGYSD